MFQRLALCACLVLAVASFSRPALAFPLCEEGKADNIEGDTADDDNDPPERVILPCAVADSAAAGCADAAIYVVTNAGVLLCQIDIPLLASSSGEQIDDTPSAPVASSSSFYFAAALPVRTVGLPPVLVRSVPRPLPPLLLGEREGHASFTTPPS